MLEKPRGGVFWGHSTHVDFLRYLARYLLVLVPAGGGQTSRNTVNLPCRHASLITLPQEPVGYPAASSRAALSVVEVGSVCSIRDVRRSKRVIDHTQQVAFAPAPPGEGR